MRHLTVTAAAVTLAAAALAGLAACSSSSSSAAGAGNSPTTGSAGSSGTTGSTGSEGGNASTAACGNAAVQSQLYNKGVLTVATDTPAYTPWFVNNTPSNGQGYESAVAYAVAQQLGFSKDQVKWVTEPFDNSYAPGPKKFDFDINEISYSSDRANAVTFSDGYYDVQQAIVATKGSPIVAKHSPADLKNYVYGDQIGTTSLQYINGQIQPTQQPKVYDDLNGAITALRNHQIGAIVLDTPTAQYAASSQIPNGVVVGQFPAAGEHFGLVFAKGNPLVTCVNQALSQLKANGTLNQLAQKWLQVYTSIPTIQP